ncbi:MAG: hypothetical protein IPK83_24615 [Planctomycetes bacterium]|nr:hypothetical protein [Planctomycetota bacterium]
MKSDNAATALLFTWCKVVRETLRDYLGARGRLSEHEAMTIMVPIMGALVVAHRGIVHRDIKPENIILTSTSSEIVPKARRFGLARVHSPDPGGTNSRSMAS